MSSACVTLIFGETRRREEYVNTTTTSTFPTNGTWLSRWHQIYTAAPATPERVDVPVTVLPQNLTTAA